MLQTYKFLNSKILSIKILKKTDELFLIIYGPFGFTVLKLDNLLIKKKNLQFFFVQIKNIKKIKFSIHLIKSITKGLKNGFKLILELNGVGFKMIKENNLLTFDLGFSHKVYYNIPIDLKIEIKKNKFLKIFGIVLNYVTQTAVRIKFLKKPDIYKGKGFRYRKELLKLKQGKKNKK
jgi:large subunit ribosomal protein L6